MIFTFLQNIHIGELNSQFTNNNKSCIFRLALHTPVTVELRNKKCQIFPFYFVSMRSNSIIRLFDKFAVYMGVHGKIEIRQIPCALIKHWKHRFKINGSWVCEMFFVASFRTSCEHPPKYVNYFIFLIAVFSLVKPYEMNGISLSHITRSLRTLPDRLTAVKRGEYVFLFILYCVNSNNTRAQLHQTIHKNVVNSKRWRYVDSCHIRIDLVNKNENDVQCVDCVLCLMLLTLHSHTRMTNWIAQGEQGRSSGT